MALNAEVKEDLQKRYDSLEKDGKLLSKNKLSQYYQTFKKRFGPDILEKLDGEKLLTTMHAHGSRESLVYWLEFKDDEEIPARFGSIAGGSALKFGIYLSSDTSEWMTGSPKSQRAISIEEAIDIAKTHRDQLIKGCELLDKFPEYGDDKDYAKLQKNIDEKLPDISSKIWVRKYFSMLYPNKLDTLHTAYYQRFYLIRILQIPPQDEGIYVTVGRYVAIANELKISLHNLIEVLKKRNGKIYRYWRIDTGNTRQNLWELMRSSNCVAIGWPKLGDLSDIKRDRESKDRIKKYMEEHYPNESNSKSQQVFNFLTHIEEDDLVLALDSNTVLGIGRISKVYRYDSASDFPHQHEVEWLYTHEWKIPNPEGLEATVKELKCSENLIEVEKHILFDKVPTPGSEASKPLEDIQKRIKDILERKGQVILYGPPGTGKTYWAEETAHELAVLHNKCENNNEHVKICCFHPGYGYEDFIEGYRPTSSNGQVHFELRDGIFKKLCKDAKENSNYNFYLIIDEINRGDIYKIFGELLMILEKNKRGKKVTLPLSQKPFSIPDNLFVIGTMNTADRSIALLDTALRRRFGFIELMPDTSILKDRVIEGIPLDLWLEKLNERICEKVGRDARNLQIGHSYLMEVNSFKDFAKVVRESIIPLLEEYCYEDYSLLQGLLGKAIVDSKTMTIKDELFDGSHDDDLIQALLEPCSEIFATRKSAATVPETPDYDV